jgi:hypothetical protein
MNRWRRGAQRHRTEGCSSERPRCGDGMTVPPNLRAHGRVQEVEKHQRLTAVHARAMVAMEGCRGGPATRAPSGRRRSEANMAASAHRRHMPWPNENEHRMGKVEVSSWAQAIEKLTKLRALPPTSRAWGVFDRRRAIHTIADRWCTTELGKNRAASYLPRRATDMIKGPTHSGNAICRGRQRRLAGEGRAGQSADSEPQQQLPNPLVGRDSRRKQGTRKGQALTRLVLALATHAGCQRVHRRAAPQMNVRPTGRDHGLAQHHSR